MFPISSEIATMDVRILMTAVFNGTYLKSHEQVNFFSNATEIFFSTVRLRYLIIEN